jgi:exopolysaccharide production negative regulator
MRTRSPIVSAAAVSLALALGGSALAFDPPRPGAGAANAVEVDPPRPPGTIPRARAVAPAAIPNSAGAVMPVTRPIPVPPAATPALALPAVPVDPTPRLGPADPPLDAPNVPSYAPSNPPMAPVTPFEAFRSGAQMLRHGDKEKALRALQYAAEQGVVAAQWKLGRMYAEGDGVEQSDFRAFEYFSRIADMHADDPPGTPQARFVANAFVAVGHYYATGIPNSPVKVDIPRARQMYYHAATYFGDAEAQYAFGRVLFDGAGSPKDPRRAAQWFYSAANKGQYKAQAMLGRMLFKGEPGVPRQAARGLMWLALAKSNAGPTEAWIGDLYESALKQANEDERALAGEFLLQWMSGRAAASARP